MANIRLYPPYGTREQSSSVKFEIYDIDTDKIKIDIENVTDSVKADVKHLKKIESGYGGVVDLNIPEHSSQSSISVFTTIYGLQEDGSYKMIQICPAIFDVKEESEEVDSSIIVSPSFISQKDLCSIKIKGEPLSFESFSVNDKILKVMINEAGYGSIHFKGDDVVGSKEMETLNKIPIYKYEGENKTEKVFTGSYVNILPSNIAVHADLDPRCDSDSDHYIVSGTWTRPEECNEDTCDPNIEVCPCDPREGPCPCNPDLENCDECDPDEENCDIPEVCIQRVGLPVRDCETDDVTIDGPNTCRIHNNSVVLLNDGLIMYAYTSPDKTYELTPEDNRYNINRVFIATQYTSPNHDIIVNRDVIVEPKTVDENFRIHVEEDLWDTINNIGDLSIAQNYTYIVFYNGAFGYQSAKIINLEIDEYTGNFILIAEAGVTNVILENWIFCVNAVIYNYNDVPNLYIEGEGNYKSLDFVRNEFESGVYVQPVNVSIATNYEYVGIDRETYVYVIVEAVTENNLSQLYYNSFSFGKDSTFDQKTYGWVRLTDETQGNNRNPVATVDSYNNLHVIFESDRGGINQLYYGNIGVNNTLSAAATFSSSIDKYSEFLAKGELPFDYFKPLLMKAAVDQEYFPIPEFDTQSVLSEKWNTITSGGGTISLIDTTYYLDDLLIIANPLSEESMAIVSLRILEDGDLVGSNPSALTLLQYNYQISFDLDATVAQNNDLTSATTVSEIEMDALFDSWKSEFIISIDSSVTNQPVYNGLDNNKYIIGRSDNIYDRVVPLVGAYKYDNPTNPSFVNSQIKILKDDNNLKDFTLGIMFEKTFLKATNIQTSVEYVGEGNNISTYTPEIVETIYTGKAKLVAFIKTTENSDTRADYIIVREFPEVLDISEVAVYDIILNYTRISSDQVKNALNTYNITYTNQFAGTMTLIINGIPKFSQSFISKIDTDDYNYFDIGFGMPLGGYYVADKMSPSKLGIFDSVSVTLDIDNITISSPTYTYNNAVVSLPPTVRNITSFKVFDQSITKPSNTDNFVRPDWDDNLISLGFYSKDEIEFTASHSESAGEDFSELYNVEDVEKVSIEFTTSVLSDRMIITTEYGTVLYDTGSIVALSGSPYKFDVDVTLIDNIYITINAGVDYSTITYSFVAYFKKVHNDNAFIQVPITYEGINQSAALDMGICNDIHIAWQSNKSKYWDIYYSNSVDELSPFRYETQITDTISNSIKPSISVNRTGKRMIAWNDNRNGDFTIYTARSLEGYDCSQKSCETKMLQSYEDQIEQCEISFIFTPVVSGIYNLVLYIYSDIDSNNLYKTIVLENNESKWFINGVSVSSLNVLDELGEFSGVSLVADEQVTISYSPDKDDKIFDIILYIKMDTVLVEEGE